MKQRGGARPGAGRPPVKGPKAHKVTFTFSSAMAAAISALPYGERSKFVEAAISEKLARK